jgi:tRNA(fMet)-specific endonuclease VapC
MPVYILDTDILSLFRGGDPAVCARVTATPTSNLAVTGITAEEQLTGWLAFIRRAKRPDQIERGYQELGQTIAFLASFRILPFTQPAVAQFENLKRQKLNVRGNDLRIAAIALAHAATVVTRNVRDFASVPGLAVEDWSQPPPPAPSSP